MKGERRALPRIAILTGASLAWNPRALKEAMALAAAGFDVVVYGANSQPGTDQALARRHGFNFEPAVPAPHTLSGRLYGLGARLRTRASRDAYRLFGIESRWQLGPLVSALLQKSAGDGADYFIVHSEPAAWVGVQLLRSGKRVGIDMEDWFSEDLPPDARKTRPIRLLRDLERRLLRDAAHATCTSQAMSEALAGAYQCAPPKVIYNAFPWSDRKALNGSVADKKDRGLRSIFWFSQTIGQDRGLEDLLGALPGIKHDIEIHLRGTPAAGFQNWLAARVPAEWRSRVFLHGPVSNDELLSRIAEHDIGFAGEMKYCRNKDLTVSNKMLHYLLGGLVVIASDTAGQAEVAAKAAGAVRLYASGNAAALAEVINSFLESPERLAVAKAAALKAAHQSFCWERQEAQLVESIKRALGVPALG